MNIENLVGKRFSTCEDIASKIEQLTGYKAVVFESEFESEGEYNDGYASDYVLDYEYRDENNKPISEVGEIFYLKDKQGHYYITEVMNISIDE